MRDVANEAGVAPMTVSYTYTRPDRVASDTRKKVLAAAELLGYPGPDPVARSLRNGGSRNLGVVLGEHLSYAFEDPSALRFLAGVSQVCTENRLGLVLIPTTGSADDLDRVSEAAVSGFVLWTTETDDPILEAVAATRRPAAIQGGPGIAGITTVTADDRSAACAIALELLADAQNPLILSHPLDRERWSGLAWGQSPEVRFPVTGARLAGYRDAIELSGRDWARTPVVVAPRNTREAARSVLSQALDEVRPDAVIAMSDQLAAGAYDVLAEEVLLGGWDDTATAIELNFMSVRQSLFDQGVSCAKIAAGIPTPLTEPSWSLARH